VTFQVLGPLAIKVDGQRAAIGGPQRQGVLAALLLRANHPVPIHQLIDMLWPDEPTASAVVQVQGHISALRRSLSHGPERDEAHILTAGSSYLLRLLDGTLDLHVFRAEAAEGRRLVQAGDVGQAAATLRRALEMWRGDAFANLGFPAIRRAAELLDLERLAVLEDCVAAELATMPPGPLVTELFDLVEQFPLRERLRATLMSALAAIGQRSDALQVYRAGRRVLVDELGVEPGRELRELHQRILTGDRVEPRVEATGLVPRTGSVPRMLPAGISDFTGRIEECTAVEQAIRLPRGMPWALICGQAGLGKTALAVRVARHIAPRFPDGQLFLRMRHPDGTPVAPAVALARALQALGFRGSAIPVEPDERAALFRSATQEQQLLMVLDDLVDDGQARWLLPGTSTSAVILTSRSNLAGIEGLVRFELAPLTPTESQAMLLDLVGQARVRAEAEAASELARHCAGLPLALRIVAARLSTRPGYRLVRLAEQLADEQRRLDWLSVGDLEVRASLGVSYTGLRPEHRRVFRMLGLLAAPSFSAWVAGALINDTLGGAELALEALVDGHLVETSADAPSEPRYRLHPLVRLFAAERAEAEETAEDKHQAIERVVGGLLVAADAAVASLPKRFVLDQLPDRCWRPPDRVLDTAETHAVAWLEAERAALQSTVLQAVECGLTDLAWPLFQRLANHLEIRFDLDGIEHIAEHLLPAVIAGGDLRGEAAVLRVYWNALAFRDRHHDLIPLTRRAMHCRRQLGDVAAEIEARRSLGAALVNVGSLDEGFRQLRIALRCARRAGEHHGVARVLFTLAAERGRIESQGTACAAATHARAEALAEARLGGVDTTNILRDMGVQLAREGHFERAEAVLLEALAECGRVGDDWRAATMQISLAGTYVDAGRLDDADRLLHQGLRGILAVRDTFGEAHARYIQARLTNARGDPVRARQLVERSLELYSSLESPPYYVEKFAQEMYALMPMLC
jgi:DNA-binding SARP family transcriptional activator/tetratricopeptide (TPR) repeat protein